MAGKKNPKKNDGPKKESTDGLSSLASKALRGGNLTRKEVKSLGASVLSQDETPGKRKKKP